MQIVPKIRGFICTTTHPNGCKKNIDHQVNYVLSKGKINSCFKNVLIIGGSTGFGLSSRIVSAFGWGAKTLNIALERPYGDQKTASPGWYNTAFFEQRAQQNGCYAQSIIGDAFSDEIKNQTVSKLKNDFKELGKIDLVIYSLAAPRRTTLDATYQSVLKPIGKKEELKNLNTNTAEIGKISLEPANQDEINATIKVMGGEDWQDWIRLLQKKDLLANNFVTLAYSYIGPEVTQSIYRHGTIGQAKVHLEETAKAIREECQSLNGLAYISVNKALVTQASSAIPVLPLYISILYLVMKENQTHEGCIEQITRLFSEKIKSNSKESIHFDLDSNDFIRMDDLELQTDVQAKVAEIWDKVTSENVNTITDFSSYQNDFLNLFGFGIAGVDYEKEVTEDEYKIDL